MQLRMSLAAAAVLASLAAGQEPCKSEGCKAEKPEREMRERVGWRVPELPHTPERAGCPQCISKCAACDPSCE